MGLSNPLPELDVTDIMRLADQAVAKKAAEPTVDDIRTMMERVKEKQSPPERPMKPWGSVLDLQGDRGKIIEAVKVFTGVEIQQQPDPCRGGYDPDRELPMPPGYDPVNDPSPKRIKTGLIGELATKSLYNFNPVSTGQKKVLKAAWIWVNEFDPSKRDCGVPGLFLYSPESSPGVGKTHIAAAIGNYLASHGFGDFKFCTLKQILSDIMASFNDASTETAAQVRARYSQPRLILLDDVGKEPVPTQWARAELFELFDNWINSGTRIIRTGNVADKNVDAARDSLQARYGMPAWSRLFKLSGKTFVIDGEDHRMVDDEYSSFFSGLQSG